MTMEVLHELRMTPQDLCRMLAMTAKRHRELPRLVRVLPKIKAILLHVIRLRVTLILPKATTM
jgi:hypothetical protein